MMQEIYGEGTQSKTNYCEIEDQSSDMESLIMKEMCGSIFRECITGQLKEYLVDKESRVSDLERKVLEKEKKLRSEVDTSFEQEVAHSVTLKEEKEKLATGEVVLSATLMKKIEQFDLASQELTQELRDHMTNRQQQVISNTCKGFYLVKGELKEALRQIQVNEMEINSLNKHLELQMHKLKEADEVQKKIVVALSQAARNDSSLPEAKEKEQRKQMQAVILLAYALSEQFTQLECKITEVINANNSRLSSLIEKAEMLTNVRLHHKQRLERRYSDLKMAEAEEQDFHGEVEAVVMQNLIRSIQKEFEEKLWEQNAMFCGSQTVKWLQKFNEISSLRKELDVILKLLPNHETEQLVSLGSGDADHWEGNGEVGGHETGVYEVFDAAHTDQLSKDELVTMIRNSKRDHESEVQRMVEEIISLKGKILNYERMSSLLSRKDKDFDILKKKITQVILKLDGIIFYNEKLPALCDSTLGSLKDRLDSLLLENHQLRDLLADKKNEVKCLSFQVSEAEEKMLQHSSSEKNFLRLLANLNSSLEDTSIEASVREEVYKCVLGELTDRIKSDSEESEIKSIIMQEIYGIIYGEGTQSKTTGQYCEIEESDMESLIMQEMCGCIFRQCITGQLKELYREYLTEKESRVSLERKVLEKEKKLRSEVVGNDSLKQQVAQLVNLATGVSATLVKKIEQFNLASQELTELRGHTNRQQQDICNNLKDLDLVKGELKEAREKIKVNEKEINSLNKNLELQMHKLEEADEQKEMILALNQALEAKEKEQRKQMQAVILVVHALSEQFTQLECKVTEDINANNSRLIYSTSQLSSLIEKAEMLTNMGLQYKQRLERKCSDLKTAEAEVDLLGDKVEKLSSLLEKIFIAIDRYSLILQHYPGIFEILKLVRRELSGETSKSV